MRARRLATVLVALACCEAALAQVTITEGTDINIDVAADGRIAMDLIGGIWVVPQKGGNAAPIEAGLLPAERPRWSPDGSALVFEARSEQRSGLYLYDFASNEVRELGEGRYSDRQPDWHPDGERLVFASQRHDTGFDLWELDVPTGLTWRITTLPGDEAEPAWSADGRNLVYIHHHEDRWSLVLRRFGAPDRVLVNAEERLSAPSWRPDGSLVTFARESADGVTMNMVILSDPLLERVLIQEQELDLAPVAWFDRQQMLYTADGRIRKRPNGRSTSSNTTINSASGSSTGRIFSASATTSPERFMNVCGWSTPTSNTCPPSAVTGPRPKHPPHSYGTPEMP